MASDASDTSDSQSFTSFPTTQSSSTGAAQSIPGAYNTEVSNDDATYIDDISVVSDLDTTSTVPGTTERSSWHKDDICTNSSLDVASTVDSSYEPSTTHSSDLISPVGTATDWVAANPSSDSDESTWERYQSEFNVKTHSWADSTSLSSSDSQESIPSSHERGIKTFERIIDESFKPTPKSLWSGEDIFTDFSNSTVVDTTTADQEYDLTATCPYRISSIRPVTLTDLPFTTIGDDKSSQIASRCEPISIASLARSIASLEGKLDNCIARCQTLLDEYTTKRDLDTTVTNISADSARSDDTQSGRLSSNDQTSEIPTAISHYKSSGICSPLRFSTSISKAHYSKPTSVSSASLPVKAPHRRSGSSPVSRFSTDSSSASGDGQSTTQNRSVMSASTLPRHLHPLRESTRDTFSRRDFERYGRPSISRPIHVESTAPTSANNRYSSASEAIAAYSTVRSSRFTSFLGHSSSRQTSLHSLSGFPHSSCNNDTVSSRFGHGIRSKFSRLGSRRSKYSNSTRPQTRDCIAYNTVDAPFDDDNGADLTYSQKSNLDDSSTGYGSTANSVWRQGTKAATGATTYSSRRFGWRASNGIVYSGGSSGTALITANCL